MPRRRITFDQFIVALEIPRELPAPAARKLRRALQRRTFPTRLRQLIRDWLRQSPAFAEVSVTVSR